jgi:tryptophanyl-tRNA synthetase
VYCVVDIHALTTVQSKEEAGEIHGNIREMVLDWLAAGVDPKRSIVFVQSHVPEVLTLHALLSMVTPLGWLLRVPTFKEKVRQVTKSGGNASEDALIEGDEAVNYGLLGYPVLQAADIILYKARYVPVGQDQVPHLELAREIVRRFNRIFGETFPEPQAKLTEAPLVVGLDGKDKMSKSLDNHVELAATAEETRKRVLTAFTDPQRLRRTDPGRPSVCNVYSLHTLFSTAAEVQTVYDECTTAKRGCVDCKAHLADNINKALAPMRERRARYAQRPEMVDEVLADGARRARAIAQVTMAEVRERVGLGQAPA